MANTLIRNLEFKLNISGTIEPGKDYIPVTGKIIKEDDLLLGMEAMADGWLTAGRFANQFEKEFAAYFDAQSAYWSTQVPPQTWLLFML